jgi:hypothetical protein
MRTFLLAAALGPFFLAGSLRANLIVNPGFETGDYTGWTLSNSQGPGYNGISNIVPHSGTYSAYFGQASGLVDLSQTVTTVPGQSYYLSFWIGNHAGTTPQNEFQLTWGSTTPIDNFNVNSMAWTQIQGVVVATQTQTLLQFGFNNVPGWWNLDDVSLTATPEPATAAMLGLAALALAALRWNRLRTSATSSR